MNKLVFVLIALALAGCAKKPDTKSCEYWTGQVAKHTNVLQMCEESPKCKLTTEDFHYLEWVKDNRARACTL